MTEGIKKKILLLDDEPDTVFLLKTRLETKGLDVFIGVDGLEGLIKTRKEMPDLIVLDVMMPKLDGYEFFKTLKKNERYASIPVIVLTAKPEMRATFQALGCDYFATKPYNAEEIASKVSELLKRKMLIMGSFKDFRERMKSSFPEKDFRFELTEYENEMFLKIAENSYDVIVVRLADIQESPEEFMKKVGETSKNRNILTLVYCDAYVKGAEGGNRNVITQLEIDWVKAGHVLFYDSRAKQRPIGDFLKSSSNL